MPTSLKNKKENPIEMQSDSLVFGNGTGVSDLSLALRPGSILGLIGRTQTLSVWTGLGATALVAYSLVLLITPRLNRRIMG